MPTGGTPKIGADIALDGEQRFKQAISEINGALRVLGAEMKAVSAEFALNANSVDALSAKEEVLQRQLIEQEGKVRTLGEALQSTGERYGEADARTLKWQASLFTAEAELSKTNNQLAENAKKMEDSGRNTDETAGKLGGLGSAIQGVADAFGIRMNNGITKVLDGLDKFKASTVLAVGAATALVGALGKMTAATAENVKEIERLSDVTGLTAESIQELQYASSQTGVNVDSMKTSIAGLTRNLRSASEGNDELNQAFRRMGISTKEFERGMIDTDEVLYQVVERLSRIRNETQRNAEAMRLMGRSASDLGPLFELGGRGMREMAIEANKLGVVMDEQTRKKFADLYNAMSRMNAVGDSVKNTLALALLPVMEVIANILASIPPEILAATVVVLGIVTAIIALVKIISDMKKSWGAASDIMKAFDIQALKTVAIIGGIVAAIALIVAGIVELTGGTDRLNATLSNTAKLGQGRGVGKNARGTENWRGGWTWVGEEGPELINLPQGSKVMSNARSVAAVRNREADTGGGVYINNITVDASKLKSVAEMESFFENLRQMKRARNPGVVMA